MIWHAHQRAVQATSRRHPEQPSHAPLQACLPSAQPSRGCPEAALSLMRQTAASSASARHRLPSAALLQWLSTWASATCPVFVNHGMPVEQMNSCCGHQDIALGAVCRCFAPCQSHCENSTSPARHWNWQLAPLRLSCLAEMLQQAAVPLMLCLAPLARGAPHWSGCL